MVTPPLDRPSPSNHRSHRRVRAFSVVSRLSPPNVSVEPPEDRDQKTKKQSSTENAGPVLFLLFFLVFSCFLVCWICVAFVFVSWVCRGKRPAITKPTYQNNKKTKSIDIYTYMKH